jgi:hypothetical protein
MAVGRVDDVSGRLGAQRMLQQPPVTVDQRSFDEAPCAEQV